MNGHGLTHRSFGDGRLTPACECGWWSSTCEHAQFTRHLNAVHDAHLASGTCDCHDSWDQCPCAEGGHFDGCDCCPLGTGLCGPKVAS